MREQIATLKKVARRLHRVAGFSESHWRCSARIAGDADGAVRRRCVVIDIHRTVMHHAAMVDKELIAATSKSLILSILNEGDSYGYEIIQRVHELTENEFKWTDSMLYPVLHRLEKNGWVSSYWQASPTGRKRKYYSVSKDGLAELKEKKRQWQVANNALTSLW